MSGSHRSSTAKSSAGAKAEDEGFMSQMARGIGLKR